LLTQAVSTVAGFDSQRGTLAIFIPTSAGWIIAADKRQSPKNVFCDGIQKILIPDRPSHAAVVITGNISLSEMPDLPASELCDYLAMNPAPVDFGRTTLEFLNTEGTPLAQFNGQAFTDSIYRAIQPYLTAGHLRGFVGARVAQIIIADFDPTAKTNNIIAFGIDIDARGHFQLQPLPVTSSTTLKGTTFGPNDPPTVLPFGEVPYFTAHVLSGPGRAVVGSEYSELLGKHAISQIEPELARVVAVNLIDATSKMTEKVAAPSGIGGGASAALIGEQRIFFN